MSNALISEAYELQQYYNRSLKKIRENKRIKDDILKGVVSDKRKINEHLLHKDWAYNGSKYATLKDEADSQENAEQVAYSFINLVRDFLTNKMHYLQANDIMVCIELDGEKYPFDSKFKNRYEAYRFVWECLHDGSYTYIDLDAMETSLYADSQTVYDDPSEEFIDIINIFCNQIKNRVKIRNGGLWVLPGEYHGSIKTSMGVFVYYNKTCT